MAVSTVGVRYLTLCSRTRRVHVVRLSGELTAWFSMDGRFGERGHILGFGLLLVASLKLYANENLAIFLHAIDQP